MAGSQGSSIVKAASYITATVRKQGDECMLSSMQLSFLTQLKNYYTLSIDCVCVYLCTHVTHSTNVEFGRELVEVSSLLAMCGSQVSGH